MNNKFTLKILKSRIQSYEYNTFEPEHMKWNSAKNVVFYENTGSYRFKGGVVAIVFFPFDLFVSTFDYGKLRLPAKLLITRDTDYSLK